MSCWCTTRSSGDASRGNRPLASRCASCRVTTRPGPWTGSMSASPASSADRLSIAASAASVDRPCIESSLFGQRIPFGAQPGHRRLRLSDQVDEARGIAAADLGAARHAVRGGRAASRPAAHQWDAEAPR